MLSPKIVFALGSRISARLNGFLGKSLGSRRNFALVMRRKSPLVGSNLVESVRVDEVFPVLTESARVDEVFPVLMESARVDEGFKVLMESARVDEVFPVLMESARSKFRLIGFLMGCLVISDGGSSITKLTSSCGCEML